jgi:hypothetical protein
MAPTLLAVPSGGSALYIAFLHVLQVLHVCGWVLQCVLMH